MCGATGEDDIEDFYEFQLAVQKNNRQQENGDRQF